MGSSYRARFELSRILLQFCLILLVIVGIPSAHSQDAPAPSAVPTPAPATMPVTPPAVPAQDGGSKTEVSIQDSGTTFHLRVNLVQVHVVVRDGKGKPIDNLKKEDFLLYDQGKLQSISTFAVETRQTRLAKSEAAAKTQVEEGEPSSASKAVLPDRFVALVFDDAHLMMQDIAYVKVQVNKFIDGLPATDRVAIYSTSGQLSHNFTSDKEELKKTVLGLLPRGEISTFDKRLPGCLALRSGPD